MNGEPLIYTTKGNVPMASLRVVAVWEDAPDYIKLVLNYHLDDEVVRNDVHIYSKRGIPAEGVAANAGS